MIRHDMTSRESAFCRWDIGDDVSRNFRDSKYNLTTFCNLKLYFVHFFRNLLISNISNMEILSLEIILWLHDKNWKVPESSEELIFYSKNSSWKISRQKSWKNLIFSSFFKVKLFWMSSENRNEFLIKFHYFSIYIIHR